MSDSGALVCVTSSGRQAAPERHWQRRGRDAHSGVPPLVLPSAPRAVRRGRGFTVIRAALVASLFGATIWAGVTLAMTHAGDAAFSRRISAGCEDIEPCLSLEAAAERRMDSCSLACGRAAEEHRAARLMRFRAEERRAVRDHYRDRDRAEQLERDTERARQLDDWRRRELARAEEAERDGRHQLELERLRQAQTDRRLAEEHERRQSYYAALGPEGRVKRLEHCLAGSERCDALVLDLLDASVDDAERRKLAERNEGVTHPPPKAARPTRAHDEQASPVASPAPALPGPFDALRAPSS
jgi:hypothetical protein